MRSSGLGRGPGHQEGPRSLSAAVGHSSTASRTLSSVPSTGIFDEIDDPSEFNVATQIAAKVPIRAIARMVGVPPSAEQVFEHGLGWNAVRAANPMYSAEQRAGFVRDAIPGLQYLLDLVAERRSL